MATSGTYIYQLGGDDLINAAYRKLVVLGEGQVANTTQLTNGRQALNTLVASLRAKGMPLWARKEQAITMVSGQRDYTIGIGQAINVAFPLHLHEAVLTVGTDESQIDVNVMARNDFNLLPTTSGGIPVNCTYQPFINYGVFSVWPTPDASLPASTTIKITYQAPFQYFIASADTMDFPESWYLALIYGLADLLSTEASLPVQDRAAYKAEAKMHLENALSDGAEDGSIFFGPAQRN